MIQQEKEIYVHLEIIVHRALQHHYLAYLGSMKQDRLHMHARFAHLDITVLEQLFNL